GSAFTIWMPLKTSRPIFDSAAIVAAEPPVVRIAEGIAEEARSWVDGHSPHVALDDVLGAPKDENLRLAPGASVLVADDNADLRDYLQRLLGNHWNVSVAVDGAEALQAARGRRFDLILADVMMPNLDGFALLQAIRGDEALKHMP